MHSQYWRRVCCLARHKCFPMLLNPSHNKKKNGCYCSRGILFTNARFKWSLLHWKVFTHLSSVPARVNFLTSFLSCRSFLFLSSNPFLQCPWFSFLITTNFPLPRCRFLFSFLQLTQQHYQCVQRVGEMEKNTLSRVSSSLCCDVYKLCLSKVKRRVLGILLSNTQWWLLLHSNVYLKPLVTDYVSSVFSLLSVQAQESFYDLGLSEV